MLSAHVFIYRVQLQTQLVAKVLCVGVLMRPLTKKGRVVCSYCFGNGERI